jgi:plasmid maintenance system antidote protein VapI
MALRLEKALGSSAEFWLRMQINHDLAQARKRSAEITVTRLQPKVA